MSSKTYDLRYFLHPNLNVTIDEVSEEEMLRTEGALKDPNGVITLENIHSTLKQLIPVRQILVVEIDEHHEK